MEIFLIKEEQKIGFRFYQLFGFIKSNKISHFLASYLFVRLSTLFVVVVVMVVVIVAVIAVVVVVAVTVVVVVVVVVAVTTLLSRPR